MQVFKRSARQLLLLMVLLCTLQHVFAIDEQYAALPLRGNQLRKDSTSYVRDTVYFNPQLKLTQTSWQVRNLITFKIDEFRNAVLPDTFEVSVRFKVYFTRDVNGTARPDSTALITLGIGYNKNGAYNHRAIHTFLGGFDARVKIFEVLVTKGTLSAFENSLMLENEILINREYSFSCTNNAVKTVSHSTTTVPTKGELQVTWANERAADEYDLEWTYVDFLAASNYYKPSTSVFDPKKVFTNNGTRVSIARQNYLIPLLYDGRGYVVYRVRAVQVKSNGQRIESAWSSDYTNGLGVYDFLGHANNFNWQVNTSFAEEGKRKSVVRYFDGSLRGRQTVTKDNTTDTTIVEETFYDFQGRPAIKVLPTPSLSSMINFTPNFNSINGAEYEKSLYDGLLVDSSYCAQGAPLMDSATGASRYYSANNPLVNSGYHQYIPRAKGFPFSETRYTPDNTERISLQGGVGPDFRIGGDHATRYYYGGADQEELDALFGTEVGHASHYFKNLVRDANGQYSVSYLDMHGRTIATALAGFPTSKLDTLASNNSKTITRKLLDSNSNVIKGSVIESSKGLVVTKASPHRFRYSLLPDSIRIKDCKDSTICYDCVYDLEITITDECNNSSLPGGVPYVISRTDLKIDTTCAVNGIFPGPSGIDNSVFLREGTYLVTKKLIIRKKAMDDYRDIFLRRNTCKQLDQFIREQQEILKLMACGPDSSTCMAKIGTPEAFRNNYMLQLGIPVEDTASFRDAAALAYIERIKECEALRGNKGLDNNIYEQMLADVTPPSGQYADTSAGKIDGYSIFAGPVGNERYRTAGTFYNENGTVDPLNPGLLDRNRFVGEFKASWATTLLKLHPEYHKLVRYQQLAGSNKWDEQFGRTETYQEAVNKGYLNPANFTDLPNNVIYTYKPAYTDSLFTHFTPGYKTDFHDSLFKKVIVPNSSNISAWALATIMAHCKDGDENCRQSFTPIHTAFSLDPSCASDLDYAWRYFREMYLQEKREVMDRILTQYHNAQPGAADLGQLRNDPSHYLNFQGMSGGGQIPGLGDTEQSAKDSLNIFIDQNCRGYAEQWWEELKPCNFTPEQKDDIINRLIQVCKEGSDIDHVYGSSTVKPSSTLTDRSFEQVIKAYTGGNYNSTCNVYLITAPKPYDQQPIYFEKPVLQKPDSCECVTIASMYNEYQLKGTQDASFSVYLLRTTGTVISNGVLDTLRRACAGEITCSFLKNTIMLPPILQCNGGSKEVCTDCKTVQELYTKFTMEFPSTAAPSYDASDSAQQKRNELFERYMNTNLGFGKSTAEYLDYLTTCQNTAPPLNLLKDSLIQIRDAYTPAGSADTCKERFVRHFNQIRGTNYTFPRLDSLYAANGLFLYMCNTNCNFQKSLGSAGVDGPSDLKRTFDGGYIIAGYTNPTGAGNDGYLVKTDERGNVLWSRTYGGTGNDVFNRVRQTADSGYILTGRTHSYGQTQGAIWVVKTDRNGTVMWARHLARNTNSGELGNDIIQLSDGGYALVGLYDFAPSVVDWEVIRLTGNGTVSWARRLGTSSSDNLGSMMEDHDTLVIAGLSASNSFYDGMLLKLNQANGNVYSIKSYLVDGPVSSWFTEMDKTLNGFRITMHASSSYTGTNNRTIILDLNQNGDVIRNRRLPSQNNIPVSANASFTTSDGGYIVAQSRSVSNEDVWWYKVNATGTVQWANKIRMAGTQHLYKVLQNPDGTYTGLGITDNDILFTRISATGFSGCGDSTFQTSFDSVTASAYDRTLSVNDSLIFVNPNITVVAQNFNTTVNTICGNCFIDNLTCDSLTKIYDAGNCLWNSMSDSLVNTRRCGQGNWVVTGTPATTGMHHYLSEMEAPGIINNGVIHQLIPGVSTANISFEYRSHRDFRVQNEFALEWRVKNPGGADMNLQYYGSSTNTPGYTSENLRVALMPHLSQGYYQVRGVRTYDAALGNRNFNDWRIIKLVVKPNRFDIYYEGQLIKTIARDGNSNIYRLTRPHILVNAGTNFEMDWMKITGAGDSVMFYENFDNFPAQFGRPDPRFLVTPNCKPFWTDFFSLKTWQSHRYYTFEQLRTLFKERCGLELDGCDDRGVLLCGKAAAVFPPKPLDQHSPCDDSTLFAVSKGTLLYEAYRDSLIDSFDDRYMAKCLKARYNENFTVEHQISEYHYTLYYYDQAGNLVKTVPPQGVDVSKFNWMAGWSDSVKTARRNKQLLTPKHQLPTRYWYNTLDNPVAQQSPDGGKTRFWYDRLGREVITQNLKQRHAGNPNGEDNEFSYTRYDVLGRIAEVGQVRNTVANGTMTQLISRNENALRSWMNALAGRREQIRQTLYDLPYSGLIGDVRLLVQQRNLRNRVSMVSITDGSNPSQYNQATFYTYDIHGNVDTLLQDYGHSDYAPNIMNRNGNRWKKIVYKYDLASGKVNMVMYNPGWGDRFYHRYKYDAENRVTLVETSLDSLVWEKDARYEYYRHGPLARTTLGEQLVQGIDHAYTLQGWLKGVNSTGGTAAHDIGGDGRTSSLNQYTARDAYGFNLNYYGNEYNAINNTVNPFPAYSGQLNTAFRPLFNGNITSIASNILGFDVASYAEGPALFYNYKYDQLNRLTSMETYSGFNKSTNTYPALNLLTAFKEKVAYDANGNITRLLRAGRGFDSMMDSLTYSYYPGTNRLRRINDNVPTDKWGSNSWEFLVDIDNQDSVNNYVYDSIGNLVKDHGDKITNIKWSIYGKILEITRGATRWSPAGTIKFTYDATGNRISKVWEAVDGTKKYTWYVLDAQGNLLTNYSTSGSGTDLSQYYLSQTDRYIYGSGRLGMYTFANGVDGGPFDAQQYYSGSVFRRGWRQYELTNHLGNVMTTISDKKFGVSSGGSLIDYYTPDVYVATEYYPFGMPMRGKIFSEDRTYRYGFNGKESDWESKGWMNQVDFGLRVYDPRVGRFMSVDPFGQMYPWQSPYLYASDNPIALVDEQGGASGDPNSKYRRFGVQLTPMTAGIVDGIIEGFSLYQAGKFVWNMATDSKARNEFIEAIKIAASDPVGFAKAMIDDYIQKGKDILAWNEKGQYDLGFIIGETASGLITGGAALKFIAFAKRFEVIQKFQRTLDKFTGTLKRLLSNPCTKCLTGETLVLTKDGVKKISEIQDGELVLAYNDTLKTFEFRQVYQKYSLVVDTIYTITSGAEVIRTTYDHPFLTNKGWVEAGKLVAGDSLLTRKLEYVAINSISKSGKSEVVYNFAVEGLHNYLIGKSGIVTHNSQCDITKAVSGFYKIASKEGHYYIGKGLWNRAQKSKRQTSRKVDQDVEMEWYEVKGITFDDGEAISAEKLAYIFEHKMLQEMDKKGIKVNKNASDGAGYYNDLNDAQKAAVDKEYQRVLGTEPKTTTYTNPANR